jgi:hypothetical protein
MVRFILWILGFFGFGKEAAAVQAYQAEGAREEAAAQAAVQEGEDKIDAQVAERKNEVAASPDAGLDAELDRVSDAAAAANRDRRPRR